MRRLSLYMGVYLDLISSMLYSVPNHADWWHRIDWRIVSWKAANFVQARLVSEISRTRRPEEGTYSTIGSGGNKIDREGSLNWAPIYESADIGFDLTSCFDSRSHGDAI